MAYTAPTLDQLNNYPPAIAAALVGLASSPQSIQVAQIVESSADLAESLIASLAGSGTIVGAYYFPNASSAPSAGTNTQAMTLNIYDATGTAVGTLASATLANATQMTKWVRFDLGTITNGAFKDGYSVTAQTTHAGTCVLPVGFWVLVIGP